MGGRWLRNSLIYLLILVAIVAIVFTLFNNGGSNDQDTSLTEFISYAQNEEVERVDVNGRNLKYFLTDDPTEQTFKTKRESGDTVRQVLQDAGIEPADFPPVKLTEASFWDRLPGILLTFLPIMFIVAILFFFLR